MCQKAMGASQARIYKQYGFVHYTSPDEAEAAINAMNNRIIVASMHWVESFE